MPTSIRLSATAFSANAAIPVRYTCQGQDISPSLSWTEPPDNTRSFALVLHDPDAPSIGGWDHWVVYNIPATIRALPEAQPKTDPLPNGGLQGRNSWGNIGYGGPCPPTGPAHRYQFSLYAVDAILPLQAGATKAQLLQVLGGHILEEALLQGTYQRQ